MLTIDPHKFLIIKMLKHILYRKSLHKFFFMLYFKNF